MFLSLKSFSAPRRGTTVVFAAAAFAVGLTTGALLGPVTAGRTIMPPAPAPVFAPSIAPAAMRASHPAEVLRVLDGDTFETRVRVWPGMDITTKVRLRDIDTPEMRARCGEERVMAEAARDALIRILAEGTVGVARVTNDKYGGRVDADVSTRATADVSAALLKGGFARRYDGGRRESWCAGQGPGPEVSSQKSEAFLIEHGPLNSGPCHKRRITTGVPTRTMR